MRRRAAIAAALTAIAIAVAAWVRLGPLPAGILDSHGTSTVVVDRAGVPLYESRAADGTRGSSLDPDLLPPSLVNATIAAEDQRFFRHPGVDPIAIARAAFRDLRALRVVEGGSTITQQVAKLLLARQQHDGRALPRGITAKLREGALALRLEHRLTKRQILALYLNLAPYGNQIVGADRASRAYFNIPPELLTPAQAAFLAVLPRRPTGFNPYRDSAIAVQRARRLTDRMELLHLLDAADVEHARAERVRLVRDPSAWLAPHFVQMVLADTPEPRPSRIVTTLEAPLQQAVEGIVRRERQRLDEHNAHNVAVVVLDNRTGGWLAWEGSGDYFDQEHGGAIDGATTPRQPGSALKPFTYALAFDRGYTPASVLADVPSHFPTAEPGVVYSPRNYDGRYRGPLRARAALAGSENVPAVVLAADLGVPSLLRLLGRAGVTTLDKTGSYYGLGVTLGNAEVRLAELVAAYASFARGGIAIAPHATGASASGHEGPRIISERAAFWITDILSDDEAREFAFGRGGNLEFPFPVAVKTGTSQGYHDNWTIGYTGEVTVGVWVGNFDRTPLRNSTGMTGAGPIFHAVMLAAADRSRRGGEWLSASAILAQPSGVARVRVCALSGMRANSWCPSKVMEWLPSDAPDVPCSWHHQSERGLLVFWPAQYLSWAHEQRLVDDGDRPAEVAAPPTGRSASPGVREHLAITSPPAGAIYLIDPTLRPQFQALELKASGASGRVQWSVDGRPAGNGGPAGTVRWPLVRGSHRIAATDGRGHTAETTVNVK